MGTIVVTLGGVGLLTLACGLTEEDPAATPIGAGPSAAPDGGSSGESPEVTPVVGGRSATGAGGSGGGTIVIDPYDSHAENFAPTGSLTVLRKYHSATLLRDGRVLIAGGTAQEPLTSAELYDPQSGTFSETGSLPQPRFRPAVAALSDGTVLVAGDAATGDVTAELYDPTTETFTQVDSMVESREAHSATLLPDGKVLIAGGAGTSAELYDPATRTFTATETMAEARDWHAATLLPDGRACVAGISFLRRAYEHRDSSGMRDLTTWAELYDPATGQFTPAGGCDPRQHPTATLLGDGSVLVTGGEIWIGGEMIAVFPWVEAWRFDPVTQGCVEAGTMVSHRGEDGYTATLLDNGTVLFAGVVNPAELYVGSPTADE